MDSLLINQLMDVVPESMKHSIHAAVGYQIWFQLLLRLMGNVVFSTIKYTTLEYYI